MVNGMTEKEIKDLLELKYSELFPHDFFEQSRKKYSRLKLVKAEKTVELNGTDTLEAAEKLIQSGKFQIVEKNSCNVVLSTAAGWSGNNPALVELQRIEKAIIVFAWAKEGWINQHTSRSVLKSVFRILEKEQ